ncbi:hypothetical protein JXA84_02345 [candidate division WOR-3 bacterium]|nr:hypothetical protein [candidate division WOR-3 bacterium]
MRRSLVLILTALMAVAMFFADCSKKPEEPTTDTTKTDTTVAVQEEAFVKLDKEVYSPEEIIVVQYLALEEFDDNAWIGLIPSEVAHGDEEENDEYDVQYHLIGTELEGEVTFDAPVEPGEYDIRMFDSDFEGEEVTYASFTVSGERQDVTATIELEKDVFEPGEEIEVKFTVSQRLESSAWIGLIPSDVAHGDEEEADQYDLDWNYLDGELEGTLTYYAPDEPGSYDLRLFSSDSEGEEITSITFTVSE